MCSGGDRFDFSEHLDRDEAISEYLTAILEDDEPFLARGGFGRCRPSAWHERNRAGVQYYPRSALQGAKARSVSRGWIPSHGYVGRWGVEGHGDPSCPSEKKSARTGVAPPKRQSACMGVEDSRHDPPPTTMTSCLVLTLRYSHRALVCFPELV